MKEDPIIAEVRKVREEHAARLNYDLRAIYEDIKKQEEASDREFVSLSPKRVDDKLEQESAKRAA